MTGEVFRRLIIEASCEQTIDDGLGVYVSKVLCFEVMNEDTPERSQLSRHITISVLSVNGYAFLHSVCQ